MQGYLNHNMDNGTVVSFSLPNRTLDLTRAINPHPFTPSGDALKERCEEIFHIQVAGLAKRVLHAHAQTAVVGTLRGTGFHLSPTGHRHDLRCLEDPTG